MPIPVKKYQNMSGFASDRLLILLFPNVSVVIIIIISAITVKMKIRIFIVLQQFREDC